MWQIPARIPKWHRNHQTKVLSLVVSLLIVASTAASATPVNDETEARVAVSLQDLQRFNGSRSLDDLNTTITSLLSAVNISQIRPANYVARRRTVVQAWAQVLEAIEKSYDPAFDPKNPNDVPAICLIPPREDDGRQMPSCADPRDVRDPKARAAYVAALKDNALRTRRANYYGRLRLLDEDAMSSLEANLRVFSTVAPRDSAALDEILLKAGLSNARRTQIDALL